MSQQQQIKRLALGCRTMQAANVAVIISFGLMLMGYEPAGFGSFWASMVLALVGLGLRYSASY